MAIVAVGKEPGTGSVGKPTLLRTRPRNGRPSLGVRGMHFVQLSEVVVDRDWKRGDRGCSFTFDPFPFCG
jgi:hypothetical protein